MPYENETSYSSFTFSLCLYKEFFNLLMIFVAVCFSVSIKNTTNSFPPKRAKISGSLHTLSICSANVLNTLSPSV